MVTTIDTVHKTHQQITNPTILNSDSSSSINAQMIRTNESNTSDDISIILNCLECIITNIENNLGDEYLSGIGAAKFSYFYRP